MTPERLLVGLAAALLACESPRPSACELAVNDQAIVGGGVQAALLGLSERELGAIARIPDADASHTTWCTATLVREGWALSAAHCELAELPVLQTESPGGEPVELRVQSGVIHPDADLWLLELEPSQVIAAGLSPLPLVESALDEELEGAPVQLAGYGEARESGRSGLRFAVETVSAQTSNYLSVDGEGLSGACLGDSGGPLLLRREDGRAAVAAVLSVGSDDCLGFDRYTRIDAALPWLLTRIGAEAPAGGCDGVDAVGSCHRGAAVYCDDGALRSEACGATGQACGWTEAAGGYRCLAPETDPCDGVDAWGRCDASGAAVCVAGELLTASCDACDQRCVRAAETGKVRCSARP